MFNIHKESFEWGGRTLTLETGKIARQADGAVLATYGETIVLATVVGAPHPKEGMDFFPSPSITRNAITPRADFRRLFQARAPPPSARLSPRA